MLWVACCIAFFGFMQIDEFTVPGPDNYDESSHLSFADVPVDSHENPCLVTIKQSKTDPFHKGVSTYLVATDRAICPVLGILPYLATQAGPLFITENGNGLTRLIFTALLDLVLFKLYLDTKCFNTHNFHIGVATSTTYICIPDTYIKVLGHWQSDVY